MRLSEILNQASSSERLQVENFLGNRRLPWGKHKKIEVGRVVHNFYCRTCNDIRTFLSDNALICLVTGHNTISIDVALRCSVCKDSVEAWYLIASDEDLYAFNPVVYLDRFTRNRREATMVHGQFEDLLEQSQIAYENRLGAGSMVYLRKIFEMVTSEVAITSNISTTKPNGSRKPFRNLLQEVDEMHRIIPFKFASNGYTLFSELSEVIHGASREEEALRKYLPCRQLVLSVINNVKGHNAVARAIDALGWDVSNLDSIAEGEIVS